MSDVDNPRPLDRLTGHTGHVWGVQFSADGRTLASNGGEVRLWDVTDPSRAKLLGTTPGGTYSMTFTPDGTKLVLSEGQKFVRVQDLRAMPLNGHGDVVASVAVSPDGEVVASGSWDRTVRLWDVRDPRPPRLVGSLPRHNGEILSVGFLPDNRTLVATGAHTVQLWDVSARVKPEPLAQLPGYPDTVWVSAISPDGRTLATSDSSDRPGELWDISNPRLPRPLDFQGADFVPAGAFGKDVLVTVARSGGLRLLDARDHHELGRIARGVDRPYSVSFSPDGRYLATSHPDRAIRLWDISSPGTERLVATYTGHAMDVPSVAFAPDGRTLVSASNDRTVRLWETDASRAAERICTLAHPRITSAEWAEHFPGIPFTPPC